MAGKLRRSRPPFNDKRAEDNTGWLLLQGMIEVLCGTIGVSVSIFAIQTTIVLFWLAIDRCCDTLRRGWLTSQIVEELVSRSGLWRRVWHRRLRACLQSNCHCHLANAFNRDISARRRDLPRHPLAFWTTRVLELDAYPRPSSSPAWAP